MGSLGATQNPTPIGSQSNNFSSSYGVQEVANTALNSLANGGNISGLVFSNITGASNAKVVITLETVTPTIGGNIQIDNGTSYYQVDVNTTTSAKKIEFWTIPTSFLTNFKIFNNLGVALAANGNTCVVYPV